MTTIDKLQKDLYRAYDDIAYYKRRIERLNTQLQQKENIIKEVREYIKDYFYIDKETGEYYLTHTFDTSNLYELLKILDKENKDV